MGSNTIGFIIGFGMMLVGGLLTYGSYSDIKQSYENEKMEKRWMYFITVALSSGSMIKTTGLFLLGLIIVLLLFLEIIGVAHTS